MGGKIRLFFVLIGVGMLWATAGAVNAAKPGALAAAFQDCPPAEKTNSAIINTFVGDTFADWVLTVDEAFDQTTYHWSDTITGGLVFIILFHFDCGYTTSNIDFLTNDESWRVIFSYYNSWEMTATCELRGLRLYEFNVTFAGSEYLARYWFDPVTPQRLEQFSLTEPVYERERLDTYAGRIYPELPSCSDISGDGV